MIRKISAASLVLLIVMPFTAPWSTCDLASLMGRSPVHHGSGTKAAYEQATFVSRAPMRREQDPSAPAVVAVTNAPAVSRSTNRYRDPSMALRTSVAGIVSLARDGWRQASPPPLEGA